MCLADTQKHSREDKHRHTCKDTHIHDRYTSTQKTYTETCTLVHTCRSTQVHICTHITDTHAYTYMQCICTQRWYSSVVSCKRPSSTRKQHTYRDTHMHTDLHPEKHPVSPCALCRHRTGRGSFPLETLSSSHSTGTWCWLLEDSMPPGGLLLLGCFNSMHSHVL